MAGHSKWAQIKRKKGSADVRKGALFSKIVQAIIAAAQNDPDPATNLRLRGEIERARAANMPKATIERALERLQKRRS